MALLSSRFLRYALVGGFNTLLYAALLFFFLKYGAISRPVSVGLAFLIAMVFQYMANRLFTFNSSHAVAAELPRYLLAALVNYLITLIVVFLMIDCFGLSEAFASVSASLVAAVSGYLLASLWVFKV